jgi:hypothetical protein
MTITTHDPAPSMPSSWEERLNTAYEDGDVVAIARDFLARLTPYELGGLPPQCRPPAKLVDREDIASYAFDLVKHDCDGASSQAELVHRLARFFFHASNRLAAISVPRRP